MPSSSFFGLLLFWVFTCVIAQPLPRTVAGQVSIDLDRCIKAQNCEVHACASNGGLKYCYSQASVRWEAALSRLEASLNKQGGWCAAYWGELKGAHLKFDEQVMQVPSLGEAPYNTDDDLTLLLYQQRYELAYSVLTNSACRPNISTKRTRPGKPSGAAHVEH